MGLKKWKLRLLIAIIVVIAGAFTTGKVNGSIPETWDGLVTAVTGEKQKDQDISIEVPKHAVRVTLDHAVDGDTVAVKLESGQVTTVRLLLIDTPESVKRGVAVQPFAIEASDRMKQIVNAADQLYLEYDVGDRTDRYDRTLAYLYADGKNVNEMMVREGFARVAYVYPPNTKYLNQLKAAEKQAKHAKKNIWSKVGYVTDRGFGK
ncbi:hypothetical protein DUK53_05490 [Listeria sp. SHR_NRA_18]|nr:hypothetical protein DUK53_05490 [Listeria sp. SHR_NRA_18]